jgi:hypothetical protein
MSDDFRRRRRLPPEGPRRSPGGPKTDPWIITIVAALVVVAGGWFLGQGLAHLLGSRGDQAAPAATPVAAVTPAPSAQAATGLPSAAATPTTRPLVRVAPKATHKPATRTATPTPVPSAAATTQPSAAPTVPLPAAQTAAPAITKRLPVRPPTPVAPARTMVPRPISTAQPPAQGNAGETTVRAYIDALRGGDPQTAASYLANGSPDEAFIDSATRITGLTSTRESDGSYDVSVTMDTSKGAYRETFVVVPSANGARILDKNAVKP